MASHWARPGFAWPAVRRVEPWPFFDYIDQISQERGQAQFRANVP